MFELTELDRKIANLINIGVITEVNSDDKTIRIQLGDNLTGLLPWPCEMGKNFIRWRPLRVGQQVILACPSGDMAQAVIVGMLYTTALDSPSVNPDMDLIEFTDGAQISYNVASHALSAILPTGASTQITSDGGINFIGDLTVTGSIHATVEVSDSIRTMSGDRAIYNSHTHSDPQGGSVSPTGQTQ